MKRTNSIWRVISVLAIAVPVAFAQNSPAPTSRQTQDANLKAYVDLLRSDLKKGKVQVLTAMMDLGPDDSAKFWPVYNEYDKSLTKLADERLAWIKMYAQNYDSLTDGQVTQIANGLLDFEAKRNQLKRDYFQKNESNPVGETGGEG